MQKGTLHFLKEFISEEQQELLGTNPDQIRSSMSKQTDEQRFEETMAQYKNPRLSLLLAVHKAETLSSRESMLDVIRCAVNQQDFVTARYWHQEKLKKFTATMSDKFELYYYTIMADQQKRHQPDAEPCISAGQMCKNASDTSHALADQQCLEHSINHRTQLVKAYQDKFDGIEESVILPAKSKDENASLIQVLIGLAFLIGGGVFLWKTYGAVATAIKNFFGHGILSLITWVIPIIYAILVIVIVCVLIYLFTKNIGAGNKKKLKSKLAEVQQEIETQMEDTDDYRALQELNKDLPPSFHTYDSRLVLAALSAMTGEQDLKKLCKMVNDNSNWLSQQVPSKPRGNNPYRHIDDLFKDGASDTDLFLGYTLNMRLYAQEGLSWNYYTGVTHGHATLTPEDFVKSQTSTAWSFLERFVRTPFGGENRRRNLLFLFNMAERFLLEEALRAESCSDFRQMGKAYFELYRMCIHGKIDRLISNANQKIYTYGLAGVEHCDEFKYYVMYNKACYDEDHEYYDPYESLGFTRADAVKYASSHPRGADLRERFKEVDRHTAQRAAEARAAEVRAYWEEKGRLMREAEQAREKARAEMNARMDSIERDANLLLNGDFSTVEERIQRSSRSEMDKVMDQMRHEALREAMIRKKLDDM